MAGPIQNGTAEIAELRTRVYGIEGAIQRIDGAIASLALKFDSKAQTPWGVIFTAIGVLGGALVGYFNIQLAPINRDLDRSASIIEKLSDRFMPSADINRKFAESAEATDKHFAINAERRDDWQRYAEERSRRNSERIDEVQKQIVPRGEHEERWRSIEKQFSDHQRQIDEGRKALGDTYTLRDALASLQKQVDLLGTKVGRPAP